MSVQFDLSAEGTLGFMARELVMSVVSAADITTYIDLVTNSVESQASMELPSGWNSGLKEMEDYEQTKAVLTLTETPYKLMKGAVLDLTSSFGLTRDYVSKTPADLIEPNVNFWLKHQDKKHRLLLKDDLVLAVCKQTKVAPMPASSLVAQLFEGVGSASEEYAEAEAIYVSASLDYTSVIVVDNHSYKMAGDEWRYGVAMTTSVTGATPLRLIPVLCWVSATDRGALVLPDVPVRRYKPQAETDLVDAEDWVFTNASELLVQARQSNELDELEKLIDYNVDELGQLLTEFFDRSKLPMSVRSAMLETLELGEEMDAYAVVGALVEASGSAQLDAKDAEKAIFAAGALVHQLTERCDKCHRLPVA